jgi:membrane protease YdiL (CAAX protease family)
MQELSATVVALVTAAGLGSLATLFWLFQKHIDGQPLLTYEPRRPVPWNFLAPLALLVPLLGLSLAQPIGASLEQTADHAALASSAVAGAAVGAPAAAMASCAVQSAAVEYMDRRGEQATHLWAIWAQVAGSLALTLACFTLLTLAFGASRHDLGLPRSWGELRGDAAIGATAFLAALVPIYAVQILLTTLLDPERGHPLIEELAVNHSPQMMAAAAMAAVLAAPLFEETAFRLTFQGWLERVQERSFVFRSRLVEDDPLIGAVEALGVDPRPAPDVVPAVAPGWAPVLISGLVFAAAHAGHGVAPGSLVVLGVVLGYLYQRTHRIVPSIVCHMCFNGYSIGVLWLELRSMGG